MSEKKTEAVGNLEAGLRNWICRCVRMAYRGSPHLCAECGKFFTVEAVGHWRRTRTAS